MINEIQPQFGTIKPQFDAIDKIQNTDALTTETDAPPFDKVLTDLIKEVDVAQKEADLSIKQLVAGESNSIQDVMVKMEEADIAFQLMKEVRNKLLEAYKEVLSMSS